MSSNSFDKVLRVAALTAPLRTHEDCRRRVRYKTYSAALEVQDILNSKGEIKYCGWCDHYHIIKTLQNN